eukprot:TRINITY_DN10582_c0_g1_i1.p1 TRINITY_DN10582_c0_g1~~TRINITY_DN10582_c0_g1_i1.p1  ORF type:complete len:347 (-),score=103.19 TRINITY_DN10582_c0_g1_i1:82-1044(-)
MSFYSRFSTHLRSHSLLISIVCLQFLFFLLISTSFNGSKPREGYEMVEIKREKLKFIEFGYISVSLIGRGREAQLWLGFSQKEGKAVAIRMAEQRREFDDVVRDIMRNPHPNLVEFKGIERKNGEENVLVFMEYLPISLEKLIKTHPTSQLIEWFIDIADGMNHLHSLGYIHRDLSMRNIMLDLKYNAKVVDFGMTQKVSEQIDKSKFPNEPVRWSSPEALQHNKFSFKSDVWSFGVLLWEIISWGQTPFSRMNSSEKIKEEVVNGNIEKHLIFPANFSEEVLTIIKSCWAMDPNDRPSFKELSERLGLIKNNAIKVGFL